MPTTIARKRGALRRRTVKRVVSQKQKRGGGGGVRTRGRGRRVRRGNSMKRSYTRIGQRRRTELKSRGRHHLIHKKQGGGQLHVCFGNLSVGTQKEGKLFSFLSERHHQHYCFNKLGQDDFKKLGQTHFECLLQYGGYDIAGFCEINSTEGFKHPNSKYTGYTENFATLPGPGSPKPYFYSVLCLCTKDRVIVKETGTVIDMSNPHIGDTTTGRNDPRPLVVYNCCDSTTNSDFYVILAHFPQFNALQKIQHFADLTRDSPNAEELIYTYVIGLCRKSLSDFDEKKPMLLLADTNDKYGRYFQNKTNMFDNSRPDLITGCFNYNSMGEKQADGLFFNQELIDRVVQRLTERDTAVTELQAVKDAKSKYDLEKLQETNVFAEMALAEIAMPGECKAPLYLYNPFTQGYPKDEFDAKPEFESVLSAKEKHFPNFGLFSDGDQLYQRYIDSSQGYQFVGDVIVSKNMTCTKGTACVDLTDQIIEDLNNSIPSAKVMLKKLPFALKLPFELWSDHRIVDAHFNLGGGS